ncbi:MAG: 2-dehydropantoate 2-reductase [Clostridiales bacterium]|nr:2-dehydropantoate 2-reductase [Clostridiales bacterium]
MHISERHIKNSRAPLAIIGAGALGCLFAVLFSPACPVLVYDIDPAKQEILANEGIYCGSIHYRPQVCSGLAQAATAGLLLIMVKSPHTAGLARDLAPCLQPGAKVLSLQNGLGNLEDLADFLPRESLFSGVTYQAAREVLPGQIQHNGSGPTYFGAAFPGQSQGEAEIAGLFKSAGIAAIVPENIEEERWRKLVVNAAINPVAAVYRKENGLLPQLPAARSDMEALARESVLVAQALGLALSWETMWERVLAVCAATAANRASMLADVEARRLTEIEAITGSIVRLGEKHGLEVPVSRRFLRHLEK